MFKLYRIYSKYICSVVISVNSKISIIQNLSKVLPILAPEMYYSFMIYMQMLISSKKVSNGSEVLPKKYSSTKNVYCKYY